MGSQLSRLPSRFPVGTRFVIEGRGGRISLRYLEFPDGRQLELPADVGRAQARAGTPIRRRMRQDASARKF
jgi:hypothetical protein